MDSNKDRPIDVPGVTAPDQTIFKKQMVAAASEVMVAIADEADSMVQRSVDEVLLLLRDLIRLDVVFFSKFTPEHQLLRNVITPEDRPVISAGDKVPYSHSVCKRVMDGKLPSLIPDFQELPEAKEFTPEGFSIGTYMTAPVLMGDGALYGTLCSISFKPKQGALDQDHAALKAVATLLSSHVQRATY